MPYEKSKSNNSFPYTPYRSCMVGLCVVWNRTEVFLYDFAAGACNTDVFIEKQWKHPLWQAGTGIRGVGSAGYGVFYCFHAASFLTITEKRCEKFEQY